MLKVILSLFNLRSTEAELEDSALWDCNTGEPLNESARELCRRWGEDWLLDERAAAQKGGA